MHTSQYRSCDLSLRSHSPAANLKLYTVFMYYLMYYCYQHFYSFILVIFVVVEFHTPGGGYGD